MGLFRTSSYRTPRTRVILEQLTVVKLVKKCPALYGIQCSLGLSCRQELGRRYYSEPAESNPYSHVLLLYGIIIFDSTKLMFFCSVRVHSSSVTQAKRLCAIWQLLVMNAPNVREKFPTLNFKSSIKR